MKTAVVNFLKNAARSTFWQCAAFGLSVALLRIWFPTAGNLIGGITLLAGNVAVIFLILSYIRK